jgi:hypothetical protein
MPGLSPQNVSASPGRRYLSRAFCSGARQSPAMTSLSTGSATAVFCDCESAAVAISGIAQKAITTSRWNGFIAACLLAARIGERPIIQVGA